MFFKRQETKDIKWRIQQLKKLNNILETYENQILEALQKDLGKHYFESYASEILLVKRNLRFTLKHIKKWSRPKRGKANLLMFGKTSRIYTEPRGNVLIIGPFNYPIQLTLVPLITALAAGNTVILKPSEQTPHTSLLLKQMLQEVFSEKIVLTILGGKEVTETLLELPFDLIFFTGSQKVGKIVMKKASENLAPVMLELGGKSPAIVLDDADLKNSAKRIAWGALLNGGQTCVAPDYVLVEESVADLFIDYLVNEVDKMFSEFPYIVKDEPRLKRYLDENKDKIIYGGIKNGLLVPTVLYGEIEGKIVEEEIFGPIIPVIPIKNTNNISYHLEMNPYPLAFYVFTKNKTKAHAIMSSYPFGGGMINDTVLHLADESIPFGGIRTSGIGAYHGKIGFDAFSHQKSIVSASNIINTPFLYPPYRKKLKWFRKFFY